MTILDKKSLQGYFGDYGGTFVPEILIPAITALQSAWDNAWNNEAFQNHFFDLLKNYAGRPTPLTEIKRFSQAIDGPTIYLKREDLLHTGAHKLNNALGQCLLAKLLGKTRVIAETGAGQHGVATATACAHLDLDCEVYMGDIDAKRQAPNVARMQLLGAKVHVVKQGTQTLKDAVNEALRDWSESFETTHYCMGSALGPHPYPTMVAAFQAIIGQETQRQSLERFGKAPDYIVACVGGGSNAIGIFSAFLADQRVKLVGVEAGGKNLNTHQHAARFKTGSPGVLHGCFTYLLQNEHGQVSTTYSISAGLDYPAVGPQHAQLFTEQRVYYTSVTDEEAIAAVKLLATTEGIIPALESAHALAYVIKASQNFDKKTQVVINLSGRGDKDIPTLLSRGDL